MARVIWNNDIDVYNPEVIPVSIALEILKFLPIPDLLRFAQVLKNTYRASQNPKLWVNRLVDMGLWASAPVPLLKHIPLKPLDDPIDGVNHVVRVPKAAKAQVLRLFRGLLPFYYDLVSVQAYDNLKMFRQFHTPEQQAKLLLNLLKLNKIDTGDQAAVVRDKLLSLLEIFESALLREVDIHFNVEDWVQAKRYVDILLQLQNNQTLVDFFLQKVDADGGIGITVEDLLPTMYFDETGDPIAACFDQLVATVATQINLYSKIVDAVFTTLIPMMAKVGEELISNQLTQVVIRLVAYVKPLPGYLRSIPFIYEKFTTDFVGLLLPLANMGDEYTTKVVELLDMLFELVIAEYVREELANVRKEGEAAIEEWRGGISRREEEASQQIWKHVKVEAKNDFLSSFKHLFTTTSKQKQGQETDVQFTEVEAQARVLSAKIQMLTRMLLPELVLLTLNMGKLGLHRLLTFRNCLIIGLRNDIFTAMQNIFVSLIEDIGNQHLKPGFDRAMAYLQTYNPNLATYTQEHHESFDQPLVLFFELINIADLIIQMIAIFYQEEFIHKQVVKLENSILNPALQTKKRVESIVDHYVADGLNVALEILVDKIEQVYDKELRPEDYDPLSLATVGSTAAGKHAIQILGENMELLVDLADRLIVDVFQQEIAERYFQILVKVLKQSTVLVAGATNLISDLNMSYDFINTHIHTNKRMVMPLFESLKKVGNIYLILGTDAKAIAKLVSDLSKFNGIFTQEEIYKFVQRRKDWVQVKHHVEKVMYGFGFADCVII